MIVVLAEIHKMANVSQVHKGGFKLLSKQYRPVSLSLHVRRVFESD